MNSTTLRVSQASSLPRPKGFLSHDLVSIRDLAPREVEAVLELTAVVKARPGNFRAALAGKQLVMFFEKPSLRTRLTFESGMASLGGVSFFVDQTHSRLDAREKLSDIAHNLERWIDGIVLRTFEHSTVLEMAKHANIPVINALSELEHPCQALADYFTLIEKFGDARKTRLAYVGDGNNVAHSLLLTAASLGGAITVATPPGYEPQASIFERACEIAAETGIKVTEADITRHDVFIADESFLTGTAAEIIPVVKVDSRPIGTGKPGPITARMIARFREMTRETGTPIYS